MTNYVQLKLEDHPDITLYDNRDVIFTLGGLKKFLEGVTIREGYREGQPGDEVPISAALLLWFVEGSSLEVVSK